MVTLFSAIHLNGHCFHFFVNSVFLEDSHSHASADIQNHSHVVSPCSHTHADELRVSFKKWTRVLPQMNSMDTVYTAGDSVFLEDLDSYEIVEI